MRTLLVIFLLLLPLLAPAQRPGPPKERPTIALSNEKIDFKILMNGTLSSIVLQDAAEQISPYAGMGHFLCLDGFGAPSEEEQKAGMPFHGEANRGTTWKVVSQQPTDNGRAVTLSASLPLVQENVTRRFEIVNGENVIYVDSEVENPLSFDRPISWAEHATLGPPFLEKGKVAVDMPAVQCRVRPEKPGNIPPRLIYDRDFTWPMAPLKDGGEADLRLIPMENALDLASCQMDPKQDLAFVTALHLEKHLLFGYVFHREEYPWVMSWMNYTGTDRAARGMEFSTQPFDVSHRETVEMNPMFGTPTFRWLPAKSTIKSRFIMFYTQAPEGMTGVDSITLSDGKLVLEESKTGERVELAVSLPL